MRISIIDQNLYSSIKPIILANFLTANEWKDIKRIKDEIIIFSKNDNSEKMHFLWVPLKVDASDYSQMIFRVVQDLAEFENKTDIQVLDDLQTVAVGDIIRVNSFDPMDGHDNSILLNKGIDILTRTKQMAQAAASSVINKSPVHSKNPPQEVKQFVRNLKMAQTERGSFIMKLISPIDVQGQVPGEFEDFSERLPFSRRAVYELINSLKILNETAKNVKKQGYFDFNAFLETVPKGVSANLCEALSPIIDGNEIKTYSEWPIDISVTWSYLIRDRSLPATIDVSFDPELFPIIREVAQELRARNPEIITLIGWVNILERGSRTGPGLIRVIGKIDDRIKQVRIKLESEEYNIAIDAHKNGFMVSVNGTLVTERNIYHLDNPKNFHIVADDFEQQLTIDQ
jgi:hypothetical protein